MLRAKLLIGAIVWTLVPDPAAANGAGAFKRRDYQQQYLEILRQTSLGDQSAAIEALIAAEGAALAAADGEAAEALRKAELSVIEDLLPAGGEGLLPIIALHQGSYLRYRQARQSWLIPHAREMVVELIAAFESSVGTAEGRATASRLLTSLAGHLQEAQVDSTASGLYRRALNLDAENVPALLGLAFHHEQYGEYPAAVRYLETLLEVRPESGEAQLRLGVNLLRQGHEEAAAAQLRRATDKNHPSWVRSVAYQELARLWMDDGDLAAARTLLEEGVKSISDDPNLLIQLAYLSERNGSFSEDPALHRALRRPEVGDPPTAARRLYSQIPDHDLAALRRQLTLQVFDSRSRLLAALEHGWPVAGTVGQRP